MAHRVGDRIKEAASTSGTGTFTLAGAIPGFEPFSAIAGMAAGDTTWYCAVNGSQWELGLGTYGGATSLARTTVLQSSNADAAVNFTAPPVVFCTVPASQFQREVLAAARTYYVRSDGNDNNTGLENTTGGAFLTLQKASDAIEKLDLNGFDVTVQVADGTYTTGVILPNYVGRGVVTFRGNPATPANVVISTTASNCFTANCARSYALDGFKVQTTTSGRAIDASKFAFVTHSNMNFGACATGHMAINQSKVQALTNHTVSGGGQAHVIASDGGSYDSIGRTVTITNTPAFTIAWAYLPRCSMYQCHGSVFTGSATGQRYNITHCSVIFVNGAAVDFLPGNGGGISQFNATYG